MSIAAEKSQLSTNCDTESRNSTRKRSNFVKSHYNNKGNCHELRFWFADKNYWNFECVVLGEFLESDGLPHHSFDVVLPVESISDRFMGVRALYLSISCRFKKCSCFFSYPTKISGFRETRGVCDRGGLLEFHLMSQDDVRGPGVASRGFGTMGWDFNCACMGSKLARRLSTLHQNGEHSAWARTL